MHEKKFPASSQSRHLRIWLPRQLLAKVSSSQTFGDGEVPLYHGNYFAILKKKKGKREVLKSAYFTKCVRSLRFNFRIEYRRREAIKRLSRVSIQGQKSSSVAPSAYYARGNLMRLDTTELLCGKPQFSYANDEVISIPASLNEIVRFFRSFSSIYTPGNKSHFSMDSIRDASKMGNPSRQKLLISEVAVASSRSRSCLSSIQSNYLLT